MGLSIFGHAWCLLYCELHLLNRHAIILVYIYNNINAGATEFHDVKRLEMISKTGWIKEKYLKLGGSALEKCTTTVSAVKMCSKTILINLQQWVEFEI